MPHEVRNREFGQAVTWQISDMRLGFPHYVICDLSSEPTLEATQAVVRKKKVEDRRGRPMPSGLKIKKGPSCIRAAALPGAGRDA